MKEMTPAIVRPAEDSGPAELSTRPDPTGEWVPHP